MSRFVRIKLRDPHLTGYQVLQFPYFTRCPLSCSLENLSKLAVVVLEGRCLALRQPDSSVLVPRSLC